VSLNKESIRCAKGFSNFGKCIQLAATTPYTCDAPKTRIVVSIIDAKFKPTTGIPYPAIGSKVSAHHRYPILSRLAAKFNTPP
jgi:hypothetical protein